MDKIEQLKYRIKQLEAENKRLKENTFKKDLEDGTKYQDEVFYTIYSRKLKDEGELIVPFQWASAYYQLKYGESLANIEVKHANEIDNPDYIGMYIACWERRNGGTGDWKKTGILQTNMKYYAQGNDYYFYLFYTEQLRRIYNTVLEIEKGTDGEFNVKKKKYKQEYYYLNDKKEICKDDEPFIPSINKERGKGKIGFIIKRTFLNRIEPGNFKTLDGKEVNYRYIHPFNNVYGADISIDPINDNIGLIINKFHIQLPHKKDEEIYSVRSNMKPGESAYQHYKNISDILHHKE